MFPGVSTLQKVLFGALGLLVLVGLLLLLLRGEREAAIEAGENKVKVEVQEKVINDVEAANKAVASRAADPDARKSDCVRWSRTPENC